MGFDGVERRSLFTEVWQNTTNLWRLYLPRLEIAREQTYTQVMEKRQEQNIYFKGHKKKIMIF